MAKVTLLCGVPGSGKTWVMSKLGDKYHCIHNDDYIGKSSGALAAAVHAASRGDKHVVVDCPFGERPFRDLLKSMGVDVRPVFIVEGPSVVSDRYQKREGKPASQATITRAATIKDRADEWGSYANTSENVLQHLSEGEI